jgi:hypothetical protein
MELCKARLAEKRKKDPYFDGEEALLDLDECFGLYDFRCDELIALGLKKIVNYDGHGQKWRRCVACDHASADCITSSTPDHTCIHEAD